MKRIITTLLCLAAAVLAARAQSFSEVKRDKAYIYAEQAAASAREADSLALLSLSGKLSQSLDLPYSAEVRGALMGSYGEDLRRESGMLSSSGRSGISVLRYIRRDDTERIFARRRDKVKEMLTIADGAEQKGQTDVALCYYSWAASLMKSLPPLDAAAIADAESRRDAVLDGLSVSFDRQNKYDRTLVELTFKYKGRPVRNIDYCFYDGQRWSGVLSAKDGKGFIEVRENSRIEDYRIRYEVTPARLQHIFREVTAVEEAFKPADGSPVQTVQRSEPQKIDLSAVKKKVLSVMSREEYASAPDTLQASLTPVVFTAAYEEVITRICRSISAGGTDDISDCFTPEGYDIYRRLISYGNARLLNFDSLQFYALGDEVYCRSVPMAFSFKGGGRRFVEDIVFIFNGEGKICNLTFALSGDVVRDIVAHDNWTEEARIIITAFLENYKTAYALKRHDYISSIFDEDALIITGRVLKNVKGPNEYSNNRYVSLTRHNKESYMKQLARVFASQEFINIQFSDCEVVKLGKGEQLFGIKIRQEYCSATYSDTGYLFILVDLRDYRQPVIHVRTWQDAPDKEFGIIGPYNF